MRRAIISIVVVALAAWTFSKAFFVVKPDSVALVSRDGKVVRIEQPGLSWYLPFIETVGFVPVHRQYQQAIRLDAILADGSSCHIEAFIRFRAANPAQVLAWRLERGLDVSDEGGRGDGHEYTEAGDAFKTKALTALKTLTVDMAQNGAVSDWIENYSAEAHEDGTGTLAAKAAKVSCELAQSASKQTPHEPEEPAFGDLKPFALSQTRAKNSNGEPHAFFLQPTELIMRSGQRVLFEGIQVRYVVSDDTRFAEIFGVGADSFRKVAPRTEPLITGLLRGTIGALDEPALEIFDPQSLIMPQTGLGDKLEQLGIQITDIGGEEAGYRLASAGR